MHVVKRRVEVAYGAVDEVVAGSVSSPVLVYEGLSVFVAVIMEVVGSACSASANISGS